MLSTFFKYERFEMPTVIVLCIQYIYQLALSEPILQNIKIIGVLALCPCRAQVPETNLY